MKSWDSFSDLRQMLCCHSRECGELGRQHFGVECSPVVVESCIQMEGVGWDWIGWGWDVVGWGWDGMGWGGVVATGCDWLRLVATG